jgi:hypothetical protein
MQEGKFDITSAAGSSKTGAQLITIPSNAMCQASLELPTTLPAGPVQSGANSSPHKTGAPICVVLCFTAGGAQARNRPSPSGLFVTRPLHSYLLCWSTAVSEPLFKSLAAGCELHPGAPIRRYFLETTARWCRRPRFDGAWPVLQQATLCNFGYEKLQVHSQAEAMAKFLR